MLTYFSRLFAYALLLIMPLQSIAAANMLVCNSTMQLQQTLEQAHAMPCHAHMTQASAHTDAAADHGKSTPCKTSCNTLCANLCAIAALPTSNKAPMLPSVTALIGSAHFPYASITLPSLQRPPIFLS